MKNEALYLCKHFEPKKKQTEVENLNLNKLAQWVAKHEGGKQNLSIAQIKEVIRLTLIGLSKEKPSETLKTIERYSLTKPKKQ